MASPPILFDGIDTETSLLIAQLGLEDIRSRTRLLRETDEVAALNVLAEDFRQFLKAYDNYRDSGHGDLSTGGPSGDSASDSDSLISLDQSYVSHSKDYQISDHRDADILSPGSSSSDLAPDSDGSIQSSDTSRSGPNSPEPIDPLVDCIACGDKIAAPSAFRASCEHHFCEPCLEQFLTTSTTTESLFPPWCCDPNRKIDVYQLMTVDGHTLSKPGAGPLISEDLCHLIHAKLTEYAVPHTDRVYCPNPRCSVFIGSKTALQVPTTSTLRTPRPTPKCPSCLISVCLACKEPEHTGECQISATEGFDDAGLAFRNLAKEYEWQICPKCRYTVEKTSGCNHIACRCKSEFCYRCGGTWSNTHECP